MRENGAIPADPHPSSGPERPPRLVLAFWVTLSQILAAVVVFALFMIPASTATPEHPDDWAGFEYVIYGLLAAPLTALVVGPIAAAAMRLPLYGLYALPVALAALMSMAAMQSTRSDGGVQLGLLMYFIGNALVALVTSRIARRPRKPRTGVPV